MDSSVCERKIKSPDLNILCAVFLAQLYAVTTYRNENSIIIDWRTTSFFGAKQLKKSVYICLYSRILFKLPA